MIQPACWCGSREFTMFGQEYLECACGTLVHSTRPSRDITRVVDEDRDLYGRNYWFTRQAELGLPDIEERAVSDLRDRCLHWLQTVWAYKRPPGRVLEIGAAHGGFVALLAAAGFEATGVELSPWVVEYARRTSGATMLLGPLEDHDLAPHSFDLIVAFDVLEHLPDPLGTMARCAELLRDEGLLMVQTPCREPGMGYPQAAATRFRDMLISEHLYLFSEPAARRLLQLAGLTHIAREPAAFDTDMMLVAGRRRPCRLSGADTGNGHPRSGATRIVETLLSQHDAAVRERTERRHQIDALQAQFAQADRDRTERLQQIERLEGLYAQADRDRTERLGQIERLEGLYAQADRDRTERLGQIERLEGLYAQADGDRAERLRQVDALEARFREAHHDRTERLRRIEELDVLYTQADRERTEGRRQIETLHTLFAQADRDRTERLQQIEQLDSLYAQADRDRTERLQHIDALEVRLREANHDRAGRLRRIEELDVLYEQADRDRTERLQQIEVLEARLQGADGDRAERLRTIETLEVLFAQADRDRTERQHRIEELENLCRDADGDRADRRRQVEELDARCGDADRDRMELRHQLNRLETEKARLLDRYQKLNAVAADHRNSRVYKAMVRVGRWRAFDGRLRPLLDDPHPARLPAGREILERTWTLDTVSTPRGEGTIAVDLTAIRPGGENGGAKAVAIALVRELARLAPEREWLLLTSATSHNEVAGLDASHVRRRLVDPMPTALSEILDEEKLAALLCPMTAPPFDDPRVPLVCLVHDLQFLTYPEFFEDAELQGRRAAFDRVVRLADAVITPSKYTRDSVLRQSTLCETQVTVIPHGFAGDRLVHPSARQIGEVLEKHGLERDRYFVYPANFWAHKNHPMLLVAFGQLCGRRPDLDLRLVLTGASRPEPRLIQDSVTRMGLAGRVLMPGYVPDSDMSALLAGALALVFPSLYEGFGIPIIEAFSARCAAACSNVTSLPEVAGDAALYFDPRRPDAIADALERLATQPELRDSLRRSGEERLRANGSAAQMAREYLAVIDAAASAPRRSRDELAGVFGDGWTMSSIVVAHAGGGELHLELENPRAESVVLSADGAESIALPPSRTLALRCVLPSTAGSLTISVTPTFRPAEQDARLTDIRGLGVMVRGCQLHRSGADPVDLLTGGARV